MLYVNFDPGSIFHFFFMEGGDGGGGPDILQYLFVVDVKPFSVKSRCQNGC